MAALIKRLYSSFPPLPVPGAFLIYAVVCYAGFLFMLFFMPETRGRTGPQIQADFDMPCGAMACKLACPCCKGQYEVAATSEQQPKKVVA